VFLSDGGRAATGTCSITAIKTKSGGTFVGLV
jgi:hypothetical protein